MGTTIEAQGLDELAEDALDETAPHPPAYWTGTIGVEGELTGDGRLILENALEWETPLPLRFVLEDSGAHDGAVTVGRILSITREPSGEIKAFGDYDLGSEVGREAARLVRAEVLNGISMDLDSVAFEIRVAGSVLEEVETSFEDSDTVDSPEDSGGEKEPDTELPVDEEGRVIIAQIEPDDEIMVTTAARIRAATIVSIPAFKDALIKALDEVPEDFLELELMASAAPVAPPARWFEVPEPDGPLPLTITDDGQVFGHVATWDVCHVGEPSGSGVCVRAPRSSTGYNFFHTGAVKTAEGTLKPTGVLRFDTGHARPAASPSEAQAHYDNTGRAWADVHAIDGEHGIWISGALRPSITDEDKRTLQAAPLSGDWRYIQGNLEMIGVLSVNLPGFPIPRPAGMVASGQIMGLTAAGSLARTSSKGKGLESRIERILTLMAQDYETSKLEEMAARVSSSRARVQVARYLTRRQDK